MHVTRKHVERTADADSDRAARLLQTFGQKELLPRRTKSDEDRTRAARGNRSRYIGLLVGREVSVAHPRDG